MFTCIATTLASQTSLLGEVGRLRSMVWKQEGALLGEDRQRIFVDHIDASPQTLHAIVFYEGVVIAASRLSMHRDLTDIPDSEKLAPYVTASHGHSLASLNRMVVHPGFRGLGLANFLDDLRIAKAISGGVHEVFAVAYDVKRRKALAKRGFKELSVYDYDDEFQIRGPFFIMSMRAEDANLKLPTRIRFVDVNSNADIALEVA